MRRLALPLMLVLAMAVAACGGDSASDDIAKAYNGFAHDVVTSDFAGACKRMTSAAQEDVLAAGKALTGGTSKSCGDALESTMQLLDKGDLEALGKKVDGSTVKVTGDIATVQANGNKASFARQDGRWLVSTGP
jgi:hypothetical protein